MQQAAQQTAITPVFTADAIASRIRELTADFAAFVIDGGTFAGYGLEHERRFGNLPYIGRIG